MRNLALALTIISSIYIGNIAAQENSIADCTDGIDNDNDGLIDLNDDECACNDLMASSLIPNPSFEEMSCCPTGEAELNCADNWIQASPATTDYVHTCGVLGNPFLSFEAPLPFPDGEGAIGFRDGKPGAPNFKEYTGACLTGPMTAGVEYRLDFFVGFHDHPGSLTFDMAVFATTDCNNLPFGNGDSNIGCPTNTPGWVQIGEMQVKGENEWKNVVFDFTADESYTSIVLGPACEVNTNFIKNPYFFFDRLVLAERSMFTVPLNIQGDICADNLVLSADQIEDASYQWFIDGVAIASATTNQLQIPNLPSSNATFEAIVITETGCNNSEAITLEVPAYRTEISETICLGETYNLFGFVLDSTDVYTLTVPASDGCDSMVVLDLMVIENIQENITFDICTGEEIVINSEAFTTGGLFTQMLTSVEGCDSTLVISINENPVFVTDLNLEICNGQTIDINGEAFSISGNFLQTLISSNGCDSLINISISEIEGASSDVNFEFCDGDSIIYNNEAFDSSGIFQQSFVTSNGCDSIVNVLISIIEGEVNREYYTICGSNPIVINGVEYTEVGEYGENFIDSNGCKGSNIIVIAPDPICENCGSDPLFSSQISIQKFSNNLFEITVINDGVELVNDIYSKETTLDILAKYIVVKKLILDFKLKPQHFKSGISKMNSKLTTNSFIPKDWFDRNELEVSKQFRFDVNGEYQMLMKQLNTLRIGNKMSHI